jgi:MATE family multidrug resistance protein
LNGFLTASGDTRFIFWVSIGINWVAYVLPAWWFLVVLKKGATTAWGIIVFMSLVMFAIYLGRFLSGRWLKSYRKIEISD